MLAKILIIGCLLAILYTLGSSLYFLAKDKGEGDRVVRRLSWRIGLSLVLFLSLWAAFKMGWIEPTSSGPVRALAPIQQEQGSPPGDGG